MFKRLTCTAIQLSYYMQNHMIFAKRKPAWTVKFISPFPGDDFTTSTFASALTMPSTKCIFFGGVWDKGELRRCSMKLRSYTILWQGAIEDVLVIVWEVFGWVKLSIQMTIIDFWLPGATRSGWEPRPTRGSRVIRGNLTLVTEHHSPRGNGLGGKEQKRIRFTLSSSRPLDFPTVFGQGRNSKQLPIGTSYRIYSRWLRHPGRSISVLKLTEETWWFSGLTEAAMVELF